MCDRVEDRVSCAYCGDTLDAVDMQPVEVDGRQLSWCGCVADVHECEHCEVWRPASDMVRDGDRYHCELCSSAHSDAVGYGLEIDVQEIAEGRHPLAMGSSW